jgi:hypothetical protein
MISPERTDAKIAHQNRRICFTGRCSLSALHTNLEIDWLCNLPARKIARQLESFYLFRDIYFWESTHQ